MVVVPAPATSQQTAVVPGVVAPAPVPPPDQPATVAPTAWTPLSEIRLPEAPAEQISTPPAEPPPPAKRRSLRTAGIVVGATGVALAGAALAFGLEVKSLADQIEKDSNKAGGGSYDRDTEAKRSTYATLEGISLGLAGACVATGVVLFIMGRPANEPPPWAGSLSFAPVVSARHTGAVLKGRF